MHYVGRLMRVTKLFVRFIVFVFTAWHFSVVAEGLLIAADAEQPFPWATSKGDGADQYILQQLESRLDLSIKVVDMPWKRCLKSLRVNRVDGCFAGSFKTERMQMGRYPMKGEDLDPERRLHMDSYSLYRLKNSAVNWDGEHFTGISSPVGTLNGYSIIQMLKEHKLAVLEVNTTLRLMELLSRERLDAVAMLTEQAEYVLSQYPNLAAQIEKESIPLVTKPYYLLLSHEFVEQNPELAEQIWDEIRNVRQSEAYKQHLEYLLAPK